MKDSPLLPATLETRMYPSAVAIVRPPYLPVHFGRIEDTAKGNRPSFSDAARPEESEPLYERFCDELRALGVSVETGVFGARMQVELVNDGPVTIIL